MSHTATGGLVMEGEWTSVTAPNVVSNSTRLNKFDEVPSNLTTTGEAAEGAFAYHCKGPPPHRPWMHGVVVVT